MPETPLTKDQTLLVIPVYNHGSTLPMVVQRALDCGWQVLVVDDGSTDQGPATASGLGVRLLTLPVNRGKGAAILAGAAEAERLGYQAILTIDADGQHDPQAAERLLAPTATAWPAVVIGNRRMDGEFVPRASRFGRSFSNFWVHLETGLSLPDTQSGMRLYQVRELLALAPASRRFDFEIEALVRLVWGGLPVHSVEVPVYYPPKGVRISHFHQWRDNLRLTRLHTRLVLRALLPLPHKRLLHASRPGSVSLLRAPRQFLRLLLNEHASPLQIATAAWLGVFMGTLPLIGIHTVAIIYVSHRLHLNKLAAVAASQLCMPPLVPHLAIQAGFYLRHGHFLTTLSRETLLYEAGQRFWEYLLGSLVLGPLLGLVVGLLSFGAASLFKKRQAPLSPCASGSG